MVHETLDIGCILGLEIKLPFHNKRTIQKVSRHCPRVKCIGIVTPLVSVSSDGAPQVLLFSVREPNVIILGCPVGTGDAVLVGEGVGLRV